MTAYQPKTGQPCGCKRGVQRDNCPACEGTGQRIDFAAIRGARLLSIGDVGLKVPGAERDAGLMGAPRVEALRALYRKELCAYVLCDLRMGEGYREISWAQVRWDTAGARVTGEE